MFSRRSTRTSALLASVLLAGGCAGLPSWVPFGDRFAPVSAASAVDPDAVAQNLVFAAAQIPSLHPVRSMIAVKANDGSLFATRVVARLRDAGYGIDTRTEGRGRVLRTRVEGDKFTIGLGDVEVSRRFVLVNGATAPSSALYVSGTPAQDLVLNDEIFAGEGASEGFSVFAFDPGAAEASVDGDLLPETRRLREAQLARESFAEKVRANMFDSLESNYAPLFVSYEDVESGTLAFPDDSLRLGRIGKAVVHTMAERIDPETDVVSIIGCSHGRTARAGGNERLAIGRADRVKEEFLFAGVDSSQVFEEGCWSGAWFDEVMPRRGVVVTLKRRIEN